MIALGAAAWLFSAVPAQAAVQTLARDPYVGAILVEADTGRVLADDGADRVAYPASVVKLMTLLVVLDRVDAGLLSLREPVTVTAEAARMGGSQVYLAEHEVFTVDDLLYALMIQSANDAAVALAVHVAGSKARFVELMNRKAAMLGMRSTHFASPHGLPPSRGQEPDVTTARDVALLARAVLRHRETTRYTSTRVHPLRDGKFVMRTHNNLLLSFEGCDGLKTGFYSRAGFSIAATAERDGVRMIAVVLGSKSLQVRDSSARRLLTTGFEIAPELFETANASDEPVGPSLPH